MKKNFFVAVEGIDRSGKSSLVASLKKNLTEKGYDVTVLSYPNRKNHTGRLISSVLCGETAIAKEAMHLLFSANRWEDRAMIEELLYFDAKKDISSLNRPSIVLCDRYILSGVSYSVANGLPVEFALSSDKGMIEPDLTLFLDVSPQVAEKRAGYGLEIYETREFQEKVYAAMKQLLEKYKYKLISSGSNEKIVYLALKSILEQLC